MALYRVKLQTPRVSEILSLHIAYGLVESLVRGGAENIRMIPEGISYQILAETSNSSIHEGMLDALEEMMSLHEALKRPEKRGIFLSRVDFSSGAVLNSMSQKKISGYLEEILDEIKGHPFSDNDFSEYAGEGKEAKVPRSRKKVLGGRKKYPVGLTIDPSIGKYYKFTYRAIPDTHPYRKIGALWYALAWIGFHYYTPFLNVSTGEETYVHIYPVKPLQEMNFIEVLSLKDLKSLWSFQNINKNSFLERRIALLMYLKNLESIGALETALNKELRVISFTVERDRNRKVAVRSFMKIDLSRLMRFIWSLKRWNYFRAMKFFHLLEEADIEVSLPFVESILNGDLEGIYISLRGLRRENKPIDRGIIARIIEFFEGSEFMRSSSKN